MEEIILGLWPQLVALVAIAWLLAKLSEKISQAETKITVLFELVNAMRDQWNSRKGDK